MDRTDYTRLAVYGIVTRPGERGPELLLALWQPADGGEARWSMPGGGVEWGESLSDALVRELYEETGLAVEVGELAGVDQMYFDNDGTDEERMRSLRLVYDVTVTGGDLGTTEVGGSTVDAQWFPLDAIPALPHVSLVDVVLELVAAR